MPDRAHLSREQPSPSVPAARLERRVAVGALAAELGHDLQSSLNLFRLSVERLGRGDALDQEDLGLLVEELERLSHLNRRLRELSRSSLQKAPCNPTQLVELALALRAVAFVAPPALELELELEIEIDMTRELSFSCDPGLLSQALRELIDNALEARVTRAGVRFDAGASPGFCVWDDGAGFQLSHEAALGWGATTRTGAAGLGLTLALRAARAHGFKLELRRVPPLTEAWLWLPAHEPSAPTQQAKA